MTGNWRCDARIATMANDDELRKKTGRDNASLEDAFIHFTGIAMQEKGNLRDIRQMREVERKLG